MSNYTAKTFHPTTGNLEDAEWLDDHFGSHQYGVRFSDGSVHRAYDCEQIGKKAANEIEKLREDRDNWQDQAESITNAVMAAAKSIIGDDHYGYCPSELVTMVANHYEDKISVKQTQPGESE